MDPITPPDILYHGTAEEVANIIQREGIKPIDDYEVYLTDDTEIAKNAGRRHGIPFVFKVNAKKMYEDGHKFGQAFPKVYYTDAVPPQYIEPCG